VERVAGFGVEACAGGGKRLPTQGREEVRWRGEPSSKIENGFEARRGRLLLSKPILWKMARDDGGKIDGREGSMR